MQLKTALRKHLILFAAIASALAWSFSALLPSGHDEPTVDVWVLDIGQGESILLREPGGKKMLFDGGPNDSVLSELGAVLPPWDRTIDLVVVSHNHSDHIRGLIPVLERYTVKELWISGAVHTSDDFRELLVRIKEESAATKIVFHDPKACLASVCPPPVAFGQLSLQVYHPLKNMTGIRPPNQHDATVLVKASFGQQSVLLTGDIEEDHELDIVQSCRPPSCSLASTVLQEPHHGSASGLSPAFLQAVNPKAVVIPVGLDNQFDHPDPAILAKLAKAGVPVYRTDTDGRIHVELTATGYRISTLSSGRP